MPWAFPCVQATWLQGWDTPGWLCQPISCPKEGFSGLAAFPSAVWCFSPAITKQLCLSTAHHRRSFSATQLSNGLGLHRCCTSSPQIVSFVKLPGKKVELYWVLSNPVPWQGRGCDCSRFQGHPKGT